MKWRTVLAAFLACLCCVASHSNDDALPILSGEVVKVEDGDSIELRIHGRVKWVELEGTDAPETEQSSGSLSQRTLELMVANKNVVVLQSRTDQFGRTVTVWQHALGSRFDIDTADGPESGLEKLNADPAYAVVAADMKMRTMSGVEFLQKVESLSPETVRLLITADQDPQTAQMAVNEAGVFRLLYKPATADELAIVLRDALAQYRVQHAETELLEKTLKSCVAVLSDVLQVANPAAHTKACQIHALVTQICDHVPLRRQWEVEVAAMLSQFGFVTVPPETLDRFENGRSMTIQELRLMENYPKVGADLIAKIPRMENVARLIGGQQDDFADLINSSDKDLLQEPLVLKAAIAV